MPFILVVNRRVFFFLLLCIVYFSVGLYVFTLSQRIPDAPVIEDRIVKAFDIIEYCIYFHIFIANVCKPDKMVNCFVYYTIFTYINTRSQLRCQSRVKHWLICYLLIIIVLVLYTPIFIVRTSRSLASSKFTFCNERN